MVWFTFCQLGFIQNDYECCVFNKRVDEHQITLCVYVDDLFVTCYDPDIVDTTILEIDALCKGCQLHRGKVHSYLGMIFDFIVDEDLRIAMVKYLEDFLAYAVSQGQHLHLQNQTSSTLTCKRNLHPENFRQAIRNPMISALHGDFATSYRFVLDT